MMCWQLKHQEFLDGALIAGDLGCFPDSSKFDDATQRWVDRDSEEAGFSEYFTRPKRQVQSLIEENEDLGPYSEVRCPVLFVPGNHEDYDYLSNAKENHRDGADLKNTFYVDCYQKFLCIDDGHTATLWGQDGCSITIGGLWGIRFTQQGAPYQINPEAVEQLKTTKKEIDVLLTHDAPLGIFPQRGSPEIAEIIRERQPDFHFFGHVEPKDKKHCYADPDLPTESWIFEDLSFGRKMNENLAGSMGVLTWEGTWDERWVEEGTVELVTDDWLEFMRSRTWEDVYPE